MSVKPEELMLIGNLPDQAILSKAHASALMNLSGTPWTAFIGEVRGRSAYNYRRAVSATPLARCGHGCKRDQANNKRPARSNAPAGQLELE